jgi:uncharacterized membrane-anchored protein YhcB (DUF1043 family)
MPADLKARKLNELAADAKQIETSFSDSRGMLESLETDFIQLRKDTEGAASFMVSVEQDGEDDLRIEAELFYDSARETLAPTSLRNGYKKAKLAQLVRRQAELLSRLADDLDNLESELIN